MFGMNNLFENHMREMNNMMRSMNSMMNEMVYGPTFGGANHMAVTPFGNNGVMSPFMGGMFGNGGMSAFQFPNSPAQCYSSTTVMTMGGPGNKPQVYQESSSMVSGPGGIRETKKSVCDSRTGTKKLAVGRYIGDKGHVKEKEQNVYSGQMEENDEYINLEEEEADQFRREWQNKAARYMPHQSPSGSNRMLHYPSYHEPRGHHQQLALMAPIESSPVVIEEIEDKETTPPQVNEHSAKTRSKPYDRKQKKTRRHRE